MAWQIRFVPQNTGKESQKRRELQQSDQRSHSAKVAHARRRKQGSDVYARETRLQQLVAETLIETPSPPLWKGSSDPFDVLNIELTPWMNRMLASYLNEFLPSIWIPTWLRESPDAGVPSTVLVRTKRLAGSHSVTRSIEFAFSHPESLPSWLFLALATMREVLEPLDPVKFRVLLLQYRTRSLQILRESISKTQPGSPPSIQTVLQILRVFGAECMTNEFSAAENHALVIPWIEKVQLDPKILVTTTISMMHNDTEMACKLFRKTALDYDIWLVKRLNDFWNHAVSFVPPAPSEIESCLHPCLARFNGDNVYGALIRLRWSLYLRDTLGPLGIHLPEVGDLMYTWIVSKTMHDIGLLINQAIDLVLETSAEFTTGQTASVQFAILHDTELHAAVTLTTLYNIRKFLHDGSYNGVDMRDAPSIIPALKGSLVRYLLRDAVTTQPDSDVDELLFWMYFTGAWHGQKQQCNSRSATCKDYEGGVSGQTPSQLELAKDCARHNSTIAWFNARLAKQARTLRLFRWTDARQLLTHFAFSDIMRPHPSTWYREIIQPQS